MYLTLRVLLKDTCNFSDKNPPLRATPRCALLTSRPRVSAARCLQGKLGRTRLVGSSIQDPRLRSFGLSQSPCPLLAEQNGTLQHSKQAQRIGHG